MRAAIVGEDIVLVKKFKTTSDGNVGGTTLVCTSLTSEPNFNELIVKIQSGSYKGQSRSITGNTTGGTVTAADAFGGQIVSGTQFAIIGIPSGADIDTASILARIGTSSDAAGTTTVFARLRQIVETYLGNTTYGLSALKTLIGSITDASGTTTIFARLKQIVNDYLANGTYGLSALKTALNNIYNFLTGNDAGSGTLNDANTSDTLVPTKLPCSMHLIFDISNLNNANDDFDIEVKVGVAASERVVAHYNLTSNGTDITADTGSGTGVVIKIRRIDIQHILVAASEQVIVELTKNSVNDRNVTYKYVNGGGI